MKALLDLSQLAPGQRARVLGVTSQGAMPRRLQELGLLAGAWVECLGKSPLGDPAAYRVRGAVIALRQDDARAVTTKAEADPAAAEQCQECRFAHPESQAKRIAYSSVCEECTDGSNYQSEKAPEGQQETEQEEMQMATDLERQLRRQILGLTEEIRALVRTVTPAPIEIGAARVAHAAARKLLALMDRLMDIKESEQEEIEGQMTRTDWENES